MKGGSAVSLESCFAKDPNTAWRTIVDGTVLFTPDAEGGMVRVIDEVGMFIWQLMEGERSVKDIVAAVCIEFDVDEGAAKRDALEFIDQLEKAGLVTLIEKS